MKEVIKEHKLNRVVVAACTPKTHEPIFQDTMESCGLNKYLFEMANIRNQDSWVHSEAAETATEKASDLVRMSVARATTLHPLQEKKIPVIQKGLVIGGGISGLNAALGLADQGYEVFLIEKEAELGGLANRLTATIEGADIGKYTGDLISRVTAHEKIEVITNALVVGYSGFKGNFTTEIMVGPEMKQRKIEHGVVILATGAHEYKPKEEYLYGDDPRVMTQLELADRMKKGELDEPQQVVMIQCIGSRNEENPNCSRVCCQTAIKNALHIKEKYPDAEVFVLYRDIRTYGLLEDYYTEARRQGVFFFRFDPEDPPVAEAAQDGIEVTFTDHVLNRKLSVSTDLLVLSAGMEAEDTEELSTIVKLARTPEGYFMEAHVKLRPVDMATEGIFVCGTAHSPKLISESIAQAYAAASRAVTFLAQDHLTLSAVTAQVEAEKCASCLICVRSCPYDVPKINADGVSEIDEALCHGCGICTAECPAKAIQLNWYEDDQIICKVDALLEGVL
jgi:heterodisulfide reductase subunit A-like polyferredoxin